MRALAKGRGSRYQSAEEFRRDVEAVRARLAPAAPAELPPAPPDPGSVPQHRADRRRHRPSHVAAGVAALVVGALAVWLIPRTMGGPATPARAVTPTVTAPATSTGDLVPSVTTSAPVVPPASATLTPSRTTRPSVTSTTGSPSPTPTTRSTAPTSTTRSSTSVVPAGWNGPCSGTAELSNSWSGAYQAVITIRNGAADPVDDPWAATVTLPSGQTLANGWDATVSGTGTGTVTASPYSAGPLPTGGTLRFVVQVNAPTPVLPTTFRINGVSCG
jgi:hypothetical protein